VKFGPAFDREDQRLVDVFLGRNHVAHLEGDQVGRRDVRLRQFDDHLHLRAG
jgi:hypothetical protein